jgi:hypothetical protein
MRIKKRFGFFLKILLCLIFVGTASATNISGGINLGYNGGPGFQLNGIMANFAKDFPLNLQFGLAYTALNPGNSADARKIFINDATNGDPEKKGWRWDYRLDLLYRVQWFSLKKAYFYGGTRYSLFTANFKFIGGNEDFDITSNQWGFGLGLISFFDISRKVDFVLTTGLDYFLSSELGGHDTTYSPDGEDVNPRLDYDYDDADEAVNQPNFQLRLMLGLNYHF